MTTEAKTSGRVAPTATRSGVGKGWTRVNSHGQAHPFNSRVQAVNRTTRNTEPQMEPPSDTQDLGANSGVHVQRPVDPAPQTGQQWEIINDASSGLSTWHLSKRVEIKCPVEICAPVSHSLSQGQCVMLKALNTRQCMK